MAAEDWLSEDELNEYELLYIVHPRRAADELPAVIEWVNGLVAQGGGEVLTVDDWGRRRLAYPISHEFEGTYVLATLRLAPEGPRAIESQLVISEDIMRHIMIRGIIPLERGEAPMEIVEGRAEPSREPPREPADALAAQSADISAEASAEPPADTPTEQPDAEPEAPDGEPQTAPAEAEAEAGEDEATEEQAEAGSERSPATAGAE